MQKLFPFLEHCTSYINTEFKMMLHAHTWKFKISCVVLLHAVVCEEKERKSIIRFVICFITTFFRDVLYDDEDDAYMHYFVYLSKKGTTFLYYI